MKAVNLFPLFLTTAFFVISINATIAGTRNDLELEREGKCNPKRADDDRSRKKERSAIDRDFSGGVIAMMYRAQSCQSGPGRKPITDTASIKGAAKNTHTWM